MATMEKSKKFLTEVWIETKTKVTWATWGELRESTTVVLVAVMLISIFIYAVDLIIGKGIQSVL